MPPNSTDYSKIMPVTILLFRNYSHEIGDLLFSRLCWHNRRRPSILTKRKKTQFSCIRSSVLPLQNETILLWTCPPPSVVHKPNLNKITSSIPKICDFKNWLSFFVFFFLFSFKKNYNVLLIHYFKIINKSTSESNKQQQSIDGST